MKTKIISALLLVGQMALAQVTIKKTIPDFKKPAQRIKKTLMKDGSIESLAEG